MTKVAIKPAIIGHVSIICGQLRTDSLREVQMVNMNTEETIKAALKRSKVAWTGFADGEIVCMWGIMEGSILTNSGALWLITTKLVEKHSFLFLRWSQRFMEELHKSEKFSIIHGTVREDFSRSIWWLKWLGFSVNPPHDGLRYFHWEKV